MVKYEALGKDDTKQGVSAQNQPKCYPKRKVSLCCAPFMLALIDLEKFRSFQKPNRIDVLENKTRRRGAGRRLGAGPGLAGSVAESRESGGRLQSRFGGPEAKKGRWKTLDLSATLINSWPSSVEGFFPCLAYP